LQKINHAQRQLLEVHNRNMTAVANDISYSGQEALDLRTHKHNNYVIHKNFALKLLSVL